TGEPEVRDRLVHTIELVTGVTPSVVRSGSVDHVHLYSLQWARLLAELGKRDGKHLPAKYRCSDPRYLQGLYHGLIDSDGHRGASPQVTELFGVLHFLLHGSFPGADRREVSLLERVYDLGAMPVY